MAQTVVPCKSKSKFSTPMCIAMMLEGRVAEAGASVSKGAAEGIDTSLEMPKGSLFDSCRWKRLCDWLAVETERGRRDREAGVRGRAAEFGLFISKVNTREVIRAKLMGSKTG